MFYRLLMWYLRKLIKKERLRQISLGYTGAHDHEMLERLPMHLLNETPIHYSRGHYIQVLALVDAHVSQYPRYQSRLSDSKPS